MSSSSTLARVALIAAVSVVLGVSTLTPLLKRTAAPPAPAEERIEPFVLAPPPANEVPQTTATAPAARPEPEFAPQPMKIGVSNLTVEAPPPAAPEPPSASAVAPSAPAVSAASAPAFPPMQALTEEGSAASSQQAAQAAPSAAEPERPKAAKPAKRAANKSAPKRARAPPAPFTYSDQLAAH